MCPVSSDVLPNCPGGIGGDRTSPATPVAETKAERAANELDIVCPQRWGLPDEAIDDLADRLLRIWSRFRGCFKTKTRDGSQHAWAYLRGLLIMKIKRNYTNIACRVIDQDDDGQDLQQVMSDSPWSSQAVFNQIQAEICQRPELQGGMLTVDESADECSGTQKAGAGRQYLGREGKVDVGVVGVGVGYYKKGTWSLVDAGLYLPENWFDTEHATLRRRWHVPIKRVFMTKPQMALQMILAARDKGVPFEVVGCDSLYGRDGQFRADLAAKQILYMGDIPSDYHVYLKLPVVGIPDTPPGKKGRPFSQWQVLNKVEPVEARSLVNQPETVFQRVDVRQTERGLLSYPCFARRVWTITQSGQVREEWLFIRQEPDQTYSYSLSNAPAKIPLSQLALWRSQRYFAERIFQDMKSEAGWDELIARKYRAWMHHTALIALAVWFVAETKLDWAQTYPRDSSLVEQLEVEVLPALSMANVCEMLEAALPLKQLSRKEARDLVIKRLVRRTRSTRSRLKAQRRSRSPT